MTDQFNPEDILANAQTSAEPDIDDTEQFTKQQGEWEMIDSEEEMGAILDATSERIKMLKKAINKTEKAMGNSKSPKELETPGERVTHQTLRQRHTYLLEQYGAATSLHSKQLSRYSNILDGNHGKHPDDAEND